MTNSDAKLRRAGTAIGLLVGLFLATPAVAQWYPNQSLGFGDGTFQTGTVDSVSLFNGAISLAFPIGLPGLTLTYNSNIWLYEEIWESGEWYVAANPNPIFNAGIGWSLSLGKIYEPADTPTNPSDRWMYVGPDGGAHHFYDDLHRNEDDGDDDVSYTRDGSYLRMIKISQYWRKIEFPDGSIHTFSTQGCNSCWYLRKIEDRFGNVLNVDYNEDRTEWTLSDQYNRTHYINLEHKCCNIGDQVTSVDLESVGGARAIYSFHYQSRGRIRSCKDDYPGNSQNVTMPFLTKVVAPDGSTIEMLESDGDPRYYSGCAPADRPGVIEGIRLPTGGQIEWELQEYNFPSSGAEYADSSAGVETKTTLLADGTVDGVWEYKSSKIGSGSEKTMRTQVVNPTGDCSKHFFAASPTLNKTEWIGWEYGLPFTRMTEENGRFLSSEVWTSNNGSGGCSGTKLRSTFLEFEHDKLGSQTGAEYKHKWYNTNRRLRSSRTVFHDDNDRFADTDFEEFDGLGHFRSVTTSGNFRDDSATVDSRTTYTHFNRSGGTYQVDPETNAYCCGHNYQPITTTTPWVLGIFDYQESNEPYAEGITSARTNYLFDSSTGFLKATRVLEGLSEVGEHDLLTEYVEGANGQVASVRWYGGDVQTLSTGSGGIGGGGGWDFPAEPVYRVDHTYQYGVLKTSRPIEPDGTPVPFLSYDVDVDPSTGQVLTSRDPSGFATTFEYDTAGRLWKVIPSEGARTVLTYTAATGASPAGVHVAKKTNDGSSTLQQTASDLDAFGRPWLSKVLQPGNGWVFQETLYNARGWTVSTSALGDFGVKTQYLNYDPFGRPGTIRPPDGAQHDVSVTYLGVREVQQTSMVATSPGSESAATRIYRQDRQGRLWQVVEPSSPDSSNVTTTVTYDVGGRASGIETVTLGLPPLTQNRTYTFDRRGFLLEETHPEKGVSGNGSAFYDQHDPWGNVGRMIDGPSDLSFAYDALGRNTLVHDEALDRNMIEYAYDGAAGWGMGKVWQAVRHNWIDLPRTIAGVEDIEVVETYGYNGIGGGVSDYDLEILPQGFAFDQSFTYDELGNLENLVYPDCQHAGCPQDEPSRTINYGFDQGFLTQVTGFVDSIAYHPSGLWEEIEHTNGVFSHLDLDPSGIPRPQSLTTTGVSGGQDLNLGPYTYDGSGNITGIGSESFLYDEISRLVEGTAERNTEQYQYDAFGNLNRVTRTYPDQTVETRTIAVSTATNRLTTATYDAAGSMTQWNGVDYIYDALQRLARVDSGQASWFHLYTAGGERIWSIFEPGNLLQPLAETFSLRDPSGRLLRRYLVSSGLGSETWTWASDQVFGAGGLLASIHPEGQGESIRHYHLDHLGSPRLVTDALGQKLFGHSFLPYGEEVTDPAQSDSPFRFTGHERDFQFGTSMDDQDYMHARYYTPHLGRFGRVDALRGSAGAPQSLNRYAYGLGNPMKYVDPSGLRACDFVGGCGGPGQTSGGWWSNFLVWYLNNWLEYPRGYGRLEYLDSPEGREEQTERFNESQDSGYDDLKWCVLQSGDCSNSPKAPWVGGQNEGGNSGSEGEGTIRRPGKSTPGGGGQEGGSFADDCTFLSAWQENYIEIMTTMRWPRIVGSLFFLGPATAHAMETTTFLSWARSGFGGLRMAGASFTALETGVLVGFTGAANYILVSGAAFEVGVAIGSTVDLEWDPVGGPYNTGWPYLEVADCD